MNPFDWIRALAALGLTLGLLVGIALLARRYGLMQGTAPMGNKGRLRIMEQIWLDAGRSRAMIVRCDGTEHLILISPTGAHAIGTTHLIGEDMTNAIPAPRDTDAPQA